MDVTPFQAVAVTAAAQSYSAPLTCQHIVCEIGQHLIQTVTAHQYHAVLRAVSNQASGHVKHGILVEIEARTRLERQGYSIGHIEAVEYDIGQS